MGGVTRLSRVVRGAGVRRLRARNVAALGRFVWLRLRYPALRGSLFYVGPGCALSVAGGGRARIGPGVGFLRDCTVIVEGRVEIGGGVRFHRGCYIEAHRALTSGAGTLVGEGVSIHDEGWSLEDAARPRPERRLVTAPIEIGRNVWIGAGARILRGVRIGDHAVGGANAVVTRDIPPRSVAAGAPARVIRDL